MRSLPTTTRLVALVALTALTLLPTPSASAAEDPIRNRSISTSKQFIIYSEDPSVRTRAAQKAEDLKAEFLSILRAPDGWKHPIILNLGAPPVTARNPPKSQLGLYEVDGEGLKIQLDVYSAEFLNSPEFDEEILNAILLEYAYRNVSTRAGRSFENPPAWVVNAILEKSATRDSGPRAGVYATLLASGESPRLDAFLKTRVDRLDPTSRAIFRAQSSALLDAVVDLPDGRPGLHAYLAVPRRSASSINDLIPLFPSLGGEREALNRKWVLAIARASASNRIDLLGIRDTAKQLDTILDIQALPDPKNPSVAGMSGPFALEPVARSQSGRFILSQLRDDFLRLSLRAHPLYKPITDEYLSIVSDLLAKPKRRVDKRIAAAEEQRAALGRQTTEMDGYLDWVEATQIKTESTSFAEIVEDTAISTEAPPRPDAVSRVLDAYSDRNN